MSNARLRDGTVPPFGPVPGTTAQPCCPVCGTPAKPPPAPDAAPAARDPQPGRAQLIGKWMADNCHRRVEVAEMAGVAGLSVRHLQVVIKKETGLTPLHLLRLVGLHTAHRALAGQGPGPVPASMAEAAAMAGFTRFTRFKAAYRDLFGQDPVLPPAAGLGGFLRSCEGPEPGHRVDDALLVQDG